MPSACYLALVPTSPLPSLDWDSGLISEGGHFLQSRLWAEFQANIGRQVAWEMGKGWRWLAVVESGRWLKYLYSPYGPALTGGQHDAFTSLRGKAVQLGCDAVRLEPLGAVDLVDLRSRAMNVTEVQPQHTSILDLSPDLESLRKAMAEGHRYSVSAAPKRGVKVEISADPADISKFWEMMESTSKRRRFGIHTHSYFETMAKTLMSSGAMKLYIANAEDGPVASAIAFDFGQTRYYAYAAAFAERSRRVFAGVFLCWQMICDAKEAGMSNFDFWGVAPEGAANDHPWAGLSQFKRSFGGHDVSTAGTWDVPIHKSKYGLTNWLRRFV